MFCLVSFADRIAEEEQGIIPRVITGMYDLLREAKEERPNVSYSVRCQFLEIYGEDIHDLLEPAGSTVTIREGQNGEVNVHGAKELAVNGAEVRKRAENTPTYICMYFFLFKGKTPAFVSFFVLRERFPCKYCNSSM